MIEVDFNIGFNEIKNALLRLNKEAGPVLIKGGGAASKNDWKNFLESQCGFSLDRRQYSYKEDLEMADWWEISYQPDKAISYAHSKTAQPLHTDNSWFSDPAELNFFIMVKQAQTGGHQSIYYLDRLLDDLSSEEPSLLNDLLNTTVTIKKGDGTYFNKTTIITNENNDPKIYWNYYRTEKPTENIKRLCDSFFNYLKSKEGTNRILKLKTVTGDCFCFNDLKMLHGRDSFEATKPFDRVLLQSMWRLPAKN